MTENHYPNLFAPIRIGRLTLKNRIVMAPMSTNFGDPGAPGSVSMKHLAYYHERARGGVGLIIIEATGSAWSPASRRLGLYLHEDRLISGFTQLAEAIKAGGAAAGIQIAPHGMGRIGALKTDAEGRLDVSFTANDYFAASPLPHPLVGIVARELREEQLRNVTEQMGQAGRRARQAGFDVVEIHGAHGYLLCEFLSPRTNRRTDRYGGDIEGRSRFPLEVVRKVRQTIGQETVLSYRLSAEEFADGGLTIDQTTLFAKKLEQAGVDLIHVSAGTNETPDAMDRVIPLASSPPGALVPYAEDIKRHVSVPVIAVQRITTPGHAEEIIRDGKADLIALGRALIADPHWAAKAREGKTAAITGCRACNSGCMKQIILGKPLGCVVNPHVGTEQRS